MASNDNYNNETIEKIRNGLETNTDTNCALIFAYNGTGKTRLSYDFAHYGREESAPQHTLYYNAYTEDLFSWDNDIDNDTGEREYKLIINKESALIQGLAGYDITADLYKYLNAFTDIGFKIHYDKVENVEEETTEETENSTEEEVVKEIPSYVVFSKTKTLTDEERAEGKSDIIENIKISRGEERLFVWCFFRSIMDQVISDNEAYKNIEYIYIDDPMSSLDDNNVIAFAAQLYNLINDTRYVYTKELTNYNRSEEENEDNPPRRIKFNS